VLSCAVRCVSAGSPPLTSAATSKATCAPVCSVTGLAGAVALSVAVGATVCDPAVCSYSSQLKREA
jgi:hypothetical protein